MSRPNILLLHTDQQRWDALGANGNDDVRTPRLDSLAEEGVNFERHFVNNPVCMPSRESYLTGQYPSQLGIFRNGVTLPRDVETFPDMLSNYGYTSANFGKLHFLPHTNRDHRETHPSYGFDQLEVSDEPGCYPDTYRAWVRRNAPEQLDEVSIGLPDLAEQWREIMGVKEPKYYDDIEHPDERFPKEPVPFGADHDLTHTAFVADRTIDFLRTRGDEPFLCVAGFYSPHSPWVVPERFLDEYDPDSFSLPDFPDRLDEERDEDTFSDEELRRARHGYYAMVTEVDHHVGRILDVLDAAGLREDTIVVFTSDHGEMLGEHLRYGKGWPGHDAASRVPFIVRWPGEVKSGLSVAALTEAVDLVPTLLECAGIQVPSHLLGESLAPTLLEGAPAGRESALLEHGEGMAVRTEDYRYAFRRDGEELLFDLTEDPMGYHNLVDDPDYSDVLDDHRTLLLERTTAITLDRGLEHDWRV